MITTATCSGEQSDHRYNRELRVGLRGRIAKTKAEVGQESQVCEESKPPKTAKPKADPVNKKAEVIALMKRAKGAKLAEIVKATGWQAHTVRGFISILRKKRRQEDRIIQECGRRPYGTESSSALSCLECSATYLQSSGSRGTTR